MKLRLGAILLAAAITPLTVVTLQEPASAGVDTDPPAVGSCHDLTYSEYLAEEEPDAPVACSARHTSVTIMVNEFATPPDWADWGEIASRQWGPCMTALITATGGRPAQVQLSAYGLTFYRPTKAQRDAGAAWVRCDAVLRGGSRSIAPLPRNIRIDGARPPMNVRKCYLGERVSYAYTVCSRRHQYIAKWTYRMQNNGYPGERAARAFAYRKCRNKLGANTRWVYEWVYSREHWRAGLRNSVCAPRDS